MDKWYQEQSLESVLLLRTTEFMNGIPKYKFIHAAHKALSILYYITTLTDFFESQNNFQVDKQKERIKFIGGLLFRLTLIIVMNSCTVSIRNVFNIFKLCW